MTTRIRYSSLTPDVLTTRDMLSTTRNEMVRVELNISSLSGVVLDEKGTSLLQFQENNLNKLKARAKQELAFMGVHFSEEVRNRTVVSLDETDAA